MYPSDPNDVDVITQSPHSVTRTAYLHGDAALHVLGNELAHEVQVSLVENKNLNLGSTAVRIYGKFGDENRHAFQIRNLYSLYRVQMPRRTDYELGKSAPGLYPFEIVEKHDPDLDLTRNEEFQQLRPEDLKLVQRAADMLASRLI